MDGTAPDGAWERADRYENYVGRWSRRLAPLFVRWLSMRSGAAWLDVGCGTGALSQAILDDAAPRSVQAIDRSAEYINFARGRLRDERVHFDTGDAQNLPVESGAYDVAASGLVLNFVEDHARMIAEMKRAICPGGVAALYVWDYAGKMQFMRHFWNAAAALNPAARELDEGIRFPICDAGGLSRLFEQAGFRRVESTALDVDTHFRDFDDYWRPFLGAQGPAPAYTMSLPEDARMQLRERIRDALPTAIDGSIPLVARAWAVKGTK